MLMTMPEDEEFEYTTMGHIHEEGHTIRLVQLVKGTGSNIECRLFKSYNFGSGIPYEALSYVWGSSTKTKMVIVNDKSFWITQNLYDALRKLRREDEDRILWVDAICINQSHTEERNHQVMQMASIYREAERVIFWLGNSNFDIDILMNTLKCLQRKALGKGCSTWALEDNRWSEMWDYLSLGSALQYEHTQGLKRVMRSPWFRRVWILQECAHAKAGIVMCGHNFVTARIFVQSYLLLRMQPELRCQQVLKLMPGFRRNGIARDQPDLFNLLLQFKDSEASDERDKIFALYSIASDGHLLPPVDYGQPLGDLYTSLLHYFFTYRQWQTDITKEFWCVDYFVSSLTKLNNMSMVCTAASGSLSILQKLCNRPEADVNFVDGEGNSTLLQAADAGQLDIVQFLLEVPNIDINIRDRRFQTPLHRAINKNRTDIIKCLLLDDRLNVNAQDYFMQTPLHLAVQSKDHETVRNLTKIQSIEARLADRDRRTPLSIAVDMQDVESVEVLSSFICHLDALDAIWFAVEGSHFKLYCSLIRNWSFDSFKEQRKRLADFLAASDNETVLNAVDESRRTFFLWLVEIGDVELVTAMLSNPKVEVNAINGNGNTALALAITQKDDVLFQVLINSSRMDVNRCSKRGTPLMLAILNGQQGLTMVQTLMSLEETDVKKTTFTGQSIWDMAAKCGYLDIYNYLPPRGEARRISS